MARRKRTVEAGTDVDMTPMIDIVFLLIAFFMIVSDLSNLSLQEVILPQLSEAKVPKPQAGDRTIVINVVLLNDDTGEYGVRYFSSQEDLTAEALSKILQRDADEYGKFEDNPSEPGRKDSLLKLNIRCDEGANSGAIHKVFKACTLMETRIYKVSIGGLSDRANEDPYSGRERK